MHVLVTGGAGYIGSHVCKALALKGYIPVTLDNLCLGHQWAVKWGPFIEGDIANQELLASLCKKYHFLGVVHLAAFSNMRESQENPLHYYQNNVRGTLSLLEVLTQYQVPFFVLSSTCSIYGFPEQVPIDEYHPKAPTHSYGKSKWMIEQILHSISQSQGMNVAALRYFNASGADLDGEIGEAHDPETHLIPLLLQAALKTRSSFTLFGENHDTPDGTPIRDFIHVHDLAQAHVKALEWMVNNKQNLTLNLGIGKGYSVREVIHAVEQQLECTIPVQLEKQFPEDPPILIANPSQAIDTLAWEPTHSDLPTLINTAWKWHKNK